MIMRERQLGGDFMQARYWAESWALLDVLRIAPYSFKEAVGVVYLRLTGQPKWYFWASNRREAMSIEMWATRLSHSSWRNSVLLLATLAFVNTQGASTFQPRLQVSLIVSFSNTSPLRDSEGLCSECATKRHIFSLRPKQLGLPLQSAMIGN
jgi:hypothetical protein